MPTFFEKISNNLPLKLRRMSPILVGLDLPLEAPSTLNFKTPKEGGDQGTDLLSLGWLHSVQATKLERISLKLTLENSFQTNTHFAILRVILEINSLVEE
eukprot:TRINITY_DN17393_c1_g1_i1.p1 TRINITY_DN17393_c1_g1~~TRINITY_DN17393_c1_g1_i1.p1  ORF type:complete len:100 (-),score=1.90 TRINITY_DN17393_c1_g1_i1:260-559(-)